MRCLLLLIGLLPALSAASQPGASPSEVAQAGATQSTESIRLAAGDDKTGYTSAAYETDSLSLEYRHGQVADLLGIAQTPQLGLPAVPIVPGNEPSALKIQLGRKLFFDRRLSRNKTMSCAMCHVPEQGFTNNELARPIGFEGRAIKRNAPTILNVAYYTVLFADARETRLEQQVWSPLLAGNEMNNASVGSVMDVISGSPDYDRLFEQAFGEPPNMLNVGLALAQYERTLIAGDSRFDRWRFADDRNALSAKEQQGFGLFVGKAGCARCHLIAGETALFTDNLLHNTGVGYRDSMHQPSEKVSVQLAPGMAVELDRAVINSVGQDKPNDLGRYEITLNPDDRWKFRTPSLRNVALTAPYMHDGKFLSLKDVVAFYNKGGEPHHLLSPLIRPLMLNREEQSAIVMFLRSLTGSKIKLLVADAFSAPIGDNRNIDE